MTPKSISRSSALLARCEGARVRVCAFDISQVPLRRTTARVAPSHGDPTRLRSSGGRRSRTLSLVHTGKHHSIGMKLKRFLFRHRYHKKLCSYASPRAPAQATSDEEPPTPSCRRGRGCARFDWRVVMKTVDQKLSEWLTPRTEKEARHTRVHHLGDVEELVGAGLEDDEHDVLVRVRSSVEKRQKSCRNL